MWHGERLVNLPTMYAWKTSGKGDLACIHGNRLDKECVNCGQLNPSFYDA